jgi:hypothetical protein
LKWGKSLFSGRKTVKGVVPPKAIFFNRDEGDKGDNS